MTASTKSRSALGRVSAYDTPACLVKKYIGGETGTGRPCRKKLPPYIYIIYLTSYIYIQDRIDTCISPLINHALTVIFISKALTPLPDTLPLRFSFCTKSQTTLFRGVVHIRPHEKSSPALLGQGFTRDKKQKAAQPY